MVPAFKEMSTKFGRYLASGGIEPMWEAVVEITSKETQLAYALKSAITAPRQPAATLQPQATTAQQAANAAANAVAAKEWAAAAAAKKATADNWLDDEDFARLTDAGKKVRTAAWVARMKGSPGKFRGLPGPGAWQRWARAKRRAWGKRGRRARAGSRLLLRGGVSLPWRVGQPVGAAASKPAAAAYAEAAACQAATAAVAGKAATEARWLAMGIADPLRWGG